MPIAALPKATVQLLGSSQVLTTPTSLVKELIDNALDAKATSIDILISKNTLDKLEIRDNGHGISSEDFESLGKRGHTSKLRTFEELKLVAGVSLGFRGEALASAVQLGEVTMTTKTEGESVGTRLVLKAPGVVDKKTRTSHPVGTTVSVQKFMDKIPVRKKNFEKDATKTLAKISHLLRSYALARPFIRFSLKVTGVSKASFSFAPRPHDGIKEAISLVIGRDAAMECIEKSLLSAEDQPTTARNQEDTLNYDGDFHAGSGSFAIEAFLPKLGADLSKIGTAQYLSIDTRPVSHEKGTMKKIVSLFKKYMRAANEDSSEKIKNPFIRLNIKCPVASYDANVEPSKDDVLFGNECVVLELAEKLFKNVYGELEAVPVGASSKSLAREVNNFDLLLARDPVMVENSLKEVSRNIALVSERLPPCQAPDFLPQESTSSSPTVRESSPTARDPFPASESSVTEMAETSDEQLSNTQRHCGVNMSNDFGEDVDDGRRRTRPNNSFRTSLKQTPDRDASGVQLNPWIIAKMTAPIGHGSDVSGSRSSFNQPLADVLSSTQMRSDLPIDSNRFAPPIRRQRQISQSDGIRTFQPPVHRRYSASSVRTQFEEDRFIVDEFQPTPPRRRNDFVSARSVLENVLVSAPRTAPRTHERSRGPYRSSVSPLLNNENRVAQPDRLVQKTLLGNNLRPRRQSDGDQVMLLIEPDQDLAWAMDFEQRKQEATRRRREELRAAEMKVAFSNPSGPSRSSPHKNRYNAAISTLEATQPQNDIIDAPPQSGGALKTNLPDGDPRAYLMKRQKSFAAKKNARGHPMIMRTKSTRLPLERTPYYGYVHNLVYNVSVDMKKLQVSMQKLADEDLYVRRGGECVGLMIKESARPSLETKVQEVVDMWIRSSGEQKYEVEYGFGNLLNYGH